MRCFSPSDSVRLHSLLVSFGRYDTGHSDGEFQAVETGRLGFENRLFDRTLVL